MIGKGPALGPSPLGEPLVDARAVAQFLGVHVASVYRLAGRPGGLPVVEIRRGIRRFRAADVRAFVAARTVVPEMSPEARYLLASMAAAGSEQTRNPAPTERQSRLARGGQSPARAGGG